MDRGFLSSSTPRMLGWERIILSGDFDWRSEASGRKIARPLNIRPIIYRQPAASSGEPSRSRLNSDRRAMSKPLMNAARISSDVRLSCRL